MNIRELNEIVESMSRRLEKSRNDSTLWGSMADRAFCLQMRDVQPTEWLNRMERMWTDRLMAGGIDSFPESVRLDILGAWKTIKEAARDTEE